MRASALSKGRPAWIARTIARRLAAALIGLVVASLLVYVAIPVDESIVSSTDGGYLDMHVHTAGVGAGGSGAFINREMRESLRFPIYLGAFGVSEEELHGEGDDVVIEKISAHVAASRRVDKAVVLALDGVIDAEGKLDREATQLYVPNDFVARETRRYENLCFGASVNPYRPDSLRELHDVKAQGALLIKWIPNIMHIDPADEAITPFYRELVALDLPLLSHAGHESSFATARNEYGDPRRLALPLSLGVTVIAAHIGTTGTNEGEGNFERILPMFDRYPNLHADISSLTQVNRLGFLKQALAVPGLDERLVYGTDWPLQFFPLVSPHYHLDHIDLSAAKAIAAIDNRWDRDVALKEALGTPRHVFAKSAALLDVSRCNVGTEAAEDAASE